MVQLSYAGEAVQKLSKTPEDRTKELKVLIKNHGEKLQAFYYTYGEYNGFAIVELPDNVSILAVSMASGNPATISIIKTTIIITMQEAIEAMKKAIALTIKPPKG
jgi:uncharacterized protein with GYD domain